MLCIQKRDSRPVLKWKLFEGSLNGRLFHDFLSGLDIPGRRPGLILDNASAHRASHILRREGLTSIRELADAKGLMLLYMPPYTPSLNPAEHCFNTIRQRVEREEPRNEQDLRTAVRNGIRALRNSEMIATFHHAQDTGDCKPPSDW